MHTFNANKLEELVLDGELNTYESDEEVIENKNIVLTSDVTIVGKITFCCCSIDVGEYSIFSDDLFTLENCKVTAKGERDVPAILAPHGDVRNCTFNTGSRPALTAKTIKYIDFINCRGITCGKGIGLNVLEYCTFHQCKDINVIDGVLNTCTFTECEGINAENSEVLNCDFENILCQKQDLLLENYTLIANCTFEYGGKL